MVIQGGCKLVRYPPAFSNDGKRLLVCAASSVTVFSIATTLPVVHLNGHTDTVTSISVVSETGGGNAPVNRAWTSSLDGTVRLWDSEIGNVIRTLTVGYPVESMVIPILRKPAVKAGAEVHGNIAVLSIRRDKETNESAGPIWTGRVILFNLSTGKPLRGNLCKTIIPRQLVLSPHGNFVGMADNRKLWIWGVPDGAVKRVKQVKSILLHHTKALKVVAFDPTETTVSGGDETGRILSWHNFGERSFIFNSAKNFNLPSREYDIKGGVRGEDDAEGCTTDHWHASEVKCLVFSADGTYLLSGGAEATLVIWQMETGKRQFLPRLGAQLSFIVPSPDPSIFAISCLDNAIRFVNIGTMDVVKSCLGIKQVMPFPEVVRTLNSKRVTFDSQGGKLVLPTDSGSLQFYDVARDHELFEVQIIPRNSIGSGSYRNKSWSGPSTFVTHVTFSADGSVMVTVDVRLPEDDVGGASYLKFWDFESGKPEYILNTLVDEPHGAEITAVVYHPSEHMVVTCSLDATFRVWVQGASKGIQDSTEKLSAWRCRSVGSYRRREMLAAAFSPDGSLLAVGAGELVTLWNPYSNGFVSSLAIVSSQQNVTLLAFVHNSKYLVSASSGDKPCLTVWHLPTLSVQWSCYVNVEALSVDPKTSYFGIISLAPYSGNLKSQNGDSAGRRAIVALFSPENPTPSAVWSTKEGVGGTLLFGSSSLLSSSTEQLEVHGSKIKSDPPQSCMLVLTGSREYVGLNPYTQEVSGEMSLPYTAPVLEAPSAYLAMYGNSTKPRKTENSKDTVGIRASKPWGDLLSAPSHVLPSLTRISFAFMESLLEKKTDTEKEMVVS